MRAIILLVFSFCLLVFSGYRAPSATDYQECSHIGISKNISFFAKPQHHKKLHYKKGLPASGDQLDSFTETDEDLRSDPHVELQPRDLLAFSYVFVFACYPTFVKRALPFPWYLSVVTSCKYILQRVLRI